jgi:hypothetical protein
MPDRHQILLLFPAALLAAWTAYQAISIMHNEALAPHTTAYLPLLWPAVASLLLWRKWASGWWLASIYCALITSLGVARLLWPPTDIFGNPRADTYGLLAGLTLSLLLHWGLGQAAMLAQFGLGRRELWAARLAGGLVYLVTFPPFLRLVI